MTDAAKPHKFYRSSSDSVIAGVAGGLGAYFAIDPVIFRILFVVLSLVNGVGLLIYILLWLFVPREPNPTQNERVHTHTAAVNTALHASSHNESMPAGRFTGNARKGIAAALVIVGFVALISNLFSIHLFRFETMWPILLIILGVYLVFKEDT